MISSQTVVILMIVLVTLVFYGAFEKSHPKAGELVLVSQLCALCIGCRAVFSFVPYFNPVLGIVGLCGFSLGAKKGYLIGSLTALLSNFIFGQGPWTFFQMISWGTIGAVCGMLGWCSRGEQSAASGGQFADEGDLSVGAGKEPVCREIESASNGAGGADEDNLFAASGGQFADKCNQSASCRDLFAARDIEAASSGAGAADKHNQSASTRGRIFLLGIASAFLVIFVTGPMTDLSAFFMTGEKNPALLKAILLSGLPMNCILAAGTAFTIIVLGRPFLFTLERVKNKLDR